MALFLLLTNRYGVEIDFKKLISPKSADDRSYASFIVLVKSIFAYFFFFSIGPTPTSELKSMFFLLLLSFTSFTSLISFSSTAGLGCFSTFTGFLKITSLRATLMGLAFGDNKSGPFEVNSSGVMQSGSISIFCSESKSRYCLSSLTYSCTYL